MQIDYNLLKTLLDSKKKKIISNNFLSIRNIPKTKHEGKMN